MINDRSGLKEERFVVRKCASLQEHNHNGDQAELLAERILLEMAEKAEVRC